MYDYDIIVVGAGPGGSAAAEKCAKYGLKTLLLEKEKLPRDKPCGGMFCPTIRNVVGIYGTEVEDIVERRTDRLKVYFDGKIMIERDYPSFMFLRKKFDYLITRKAIESGAKVIDNCRVSDVLADSKKVKVATKKGAFTSKIVIGADGVNSIVAKKTGLNDGWSEENCALAIESEIKMSNKEIEKRYGNCAVGYLYHDFVGYEWIIPKDGCVNAGVGTKVSCSAKLRKRFDEMVRKHGLKAGDVKAHMIPMTLLKNTHNCKRRVLLCGDAAGFVIPLVGAGIEPAIISGRAAADVCYDAVKYDDYSIERFRKHEEYCRTLVKDIKESALQLKVFEFAMKYRLLKPVLVKRFLDTADGAGKRV